MGAQRACWFVRSGILQANLNCRRFLIECMRAKHRNLLIYVVGDIVLIAYLSFKEPELIHLMAPALLGATGFMWYFFDRKKN